MKKILAILFILAGVGLTVLWIINDPGFTAVFSRSAIIIGFIPIPGVLFGFVIQLIPAIAGFLAGGGMWKRRG